MINKTTIGLLLALLAFLFPLDVRAQSFSLIVKNLAQYSGATHTRVEVNDAVFPVPAFPVPVFQACNFTGFPSFTFSDDTNISDLIVRAIDSSNSTIEIASFGISLTEVAQALVRAKNRGVNIRIVMDEKQVHPNPRGELQFLIDNGVTIRTLRGTRSYGVQHNKIAIFDNRMLLTGSYNWSNYANYYNYENVIFTKQAVYLNGYKKYWDWMASYSRAFSQGPSPELPQGYFGTPPAGRRYKDFNGVKLPAYSFSPNGWTHAKLAAIVDAARESIDLATYTFYDYVLADALVRAKERGVRVRVLTDKQMGKRTALTRRMIDNGVEFRWRNGRGRGAMHHKFAIFDGKFLETGSYNWTWNAELNSFENVMFIDDSTVVNGYSQKYSYLYSGALPPSPEEFAALPADDKSIDFLVIEDILE